MAESNLKQFRSPLLINDTDSALLVIDMQEKLVPVIANSDSLIERTKLIISGANTLSVPVMFTEQYPQGLGDTIKSLNADTENVFEKKMFSCRECVGLLDRLIQANIQNIVIAGIEAHICVLQSALDCIAHGFNVHVIVDAIGSRRELDLTTAIKRMEMSGVVLTTAESVLFQWCETADHEQFKTISKLVR